ncbi:MAG: hypothetical protein IPP77_01280 [Bacteroidetes bacterium]|nr:hypothetical protein [Bacteroidota bacterium]
MSSVRSSVMNIKEASGHFKSLEELRQQLIKELDANTTLQLSEAQWNEVNQIADEKMSSFEWIYGRSPITIIKKDDVEIEVEYGIVQSLKGIGERNVKLIGAKYEYSEIQKALNDDLNQAEILQRVF